MGLPEVNVRAALFALLVAIAVTTPAAPAQTPPVNTVRQIDIVSAWGGFGPSQYAHTVIRRTSDGFAIDDMPVRGEDVTKLLASLYAPPQQAPSPDMIAEEAQRYSLDYYAKESLQRCIGAGAALDGPRLLFERLFNNRDNRQKWVGAEYDSRSFRTDDYPSERVTLTFDDGTTVDASSKSQNALMLPFTIVRNGTTYVTFDDRISRAIAALIVGGVNYASLEGGAELLDAYGDWICNNFEDEITLVVLRSWAPAVSRYIESQKIDVGFLKQNDHLSIIQGDIRFPNWPKTLKYRVSAAGKPLDAHSFESATLRALRETKIRGDIVASIPWVRHWFATARNPRMQLESFDGAVSTVDWLFTVTQLRSQSQTAYEAATHARGAVVQAILWEHDENQGKEYLFLPDGRALNLDSTPPVLIGPQGR